MYFADRGGAAPTHVQKQDSDQKIRPECFPVRYGSRVPARRKGGTSGMLQPNSAGILPEQESCPGFRPPKKRNENRNVPPRWWSPVACRVALDLPYWAMLSAPYRLIRMAIEMARDSAAFFSVVDYLWCITVAKYLNSSHFKIKPSYTIVR